MKKQRIRIFRRENGIYYSLDNITKKRHSLETTQLDEARRLINAENEAARQPGMAKHLLDVRRSRRSPASG